MNTTSNKQTTAAFEDQAVKGKESSAKAMFGKGAKPLLQSNGKKSPLKTVAIVAAIIAMFILPVVLQGMGEQLLISVFVFIGLYTILALGLNIVVGYAGLLDFGRMAFYAFGAYTAMILSIPLANLMGPVWGQWTFPIVLVASGAVAACVGFLLSLPVMRLRGDYLAIVTLGFGEIVRICLQNNIFGITNGSTGLPRMGEVLPSPPGFEWLKLNVYWELGDTFLFTVTRNVYWYFIVFALLLLAIAIVRRQDNSRLGRSWAALREDEVAATAMGVNTTRAKTWALILGALWGGVAGACYGYFQGNTSPEPFFFFNSVLVLAIVVIGGMGSIPGVIVGGLVIQGVPELVRWFALTYMEGAGSAVQAAIANYRNLVLGLLMVVMMTIRTEGILPSKRIKRELKGSGGPDGSVRIEGDVLRNEVPVGIAGATPGGGGSI